MPAPTTATQPRVLHIITGLGTGGAEASLLRVLGETRHDISHAVVSLTTVGTRGAAIATLGVPVYALELARGAFDLSALGTLRKIVREFRPTCVQGWMYHGNLAASALALSGARTGPVLWNVRHALDAWQHESRTRRAIVRGSALLSRQPRAVVYNSHRSAGQHAALGYRAQHAHVIANGVDTSRFAPDSVAGMELRAAVGIPTSAFVVGLIARVDPLKDHGTFLNAIALDQSSGRAENTWYLLAGTDTASGTRSHPGALDAQIAALVATHPSIATRLVRLGERSDVARVLNACDVVTMTSRSEGSPNAVTEAMACGVPCVVTNVGDSARLVEDSGIVVPVGDAPAIAAAWAELRRDTRDLDARGERARMRILESYSMATEASAYRSLWFAHAKRLRAPLEATARATSTDRAPRVLMVTTVSATLRAFLLPFADYFRARGWQVDAMARGATSEIAIAPHFSRTFDIAWARNPLSARNFAAIRRIRDVVLAGEYDLVHVHTPVAAFVTRFALRKLTTPVVVYTAHSFHADRTAPAWKNFLFRTLERTAARWTDHLVVLNQADYDLAREDELVPDGHLHWHPGIGVDTRLYRAASPRERRETRAALNIEESATVFVVVAEFSVNKRQRDVIDALRALQARTTSLPTVVFVGDGPMRASLEQRVQALGIAPWVRFLGFRSDVPSIVGASDALILCSVREGLPRCVLEALSMQVPVIGSSAKGTADLLQDGRGLVVPIANPAALAEAMYDIVQHPDDARERAGTAERWVQQTCALPALIAAHEALYADALGLPQPAYLSRATHTVGDDTDRAVTHAA